MVPFTLHEGGLTSLDYVIFFTLCTLSCTGGLWYGARASRTEAVVDIKDYLLGGKSMATVPVAMSLIASYVSGLTIVGTPTEIYNYGTQYYLVVVGVFFSCMVVFLVYLPVFLTLRLSSSYEYLELRFNRHVRAVASVLFLLDEVLFLPVVVYVPALAFNQLTGFNVYGVGGVMVLVCGIYTVLGGLRAVVWTDSVQTAVMFLGVILVSVSATIAVGGFMAVIRTAQADGRLSLANWSFSPYERQTGWGAVFGGFIYWTCFNSVNQTMVQRYIALSCRRKAFWALFLFGFGAILSITFCVWCGLAAWKAWTMGGCHPGGSPVVSDRLLPAFVMWVAQVSQFPGIGGIFLAGVFGAGLSSLSVVLNACALVIVEDLMRGWLRLKLKPLLNGLIARSCTALLALVSILMVVVISRLGGVLGVATALSAIAASTTCGIFTLGMAFWWVGPRGAIAGGLAGAIVAGTTSLGTQYAAATGLKAPPVTFGAECMRNASFVMPHEVVDPNSYFFLFRLSYHWVAPLGLLTTLFVGAVVGYFFDKREDLIMDAELYTPGVWRFLPKEMHDGAGTIRRKKSTLNLAAASSPLIIDKPSSTLIDDKTSSPLINENPSEKIEMNAETSKKS